MDFAAIGRQFGLDEQQTRAAFEALGPVVAAGMRQNGGGLGDILGGFAGGNPARYAEDASNFSAPGAQDDGNAILGQIFGSKDVSRGVAQQVSSSTGIGEFDRVLDDFASVKLNDAAAQLKSATEASDAAQTALKTLLARIGGAA